MVGTRPAKTRSDTSVGRLLVEARRVRKLSLNEISRELKIPAHHLQALEEGDLSVFPAEVYARGAFVQYADFLGVRAEATQHAFLRVLSGAREYVPLRVHRPRSWLASKITPRWILAGVLLGIGLIVGSYIVWQVQSFLQLPEITLIEPDTQVMAGSSATVRGVAEANARVTVNDEAVLLDSDGSFYTTLTLHPGINVLRVEAVNAAGRTRVIEQPLLMPRR